MNRFVDRSFSVLFRGTIIAIRLKLADHSWRPREMEGLKNLKHLTGLPRHKPRLGLRSPQTFQTFQICMSPAGCDDPCADGTLEGVRWLEGLNVRTEPAHSSEPKAQRL